MFGEFVWNEKLGPGIPEAKDSFAAKNLTGVDGEIWIPGGRQFNRGLEKRRGGGST